MDTKGVDRSDRGGAGEAVDPFGLQDMLDGPLWTGDRGEGLGGDDDGGQPGGASSTRTGEAEGVDPTALRPGRAAMRDPGLPRLLGGRKSGWREAPPLAGAPRRCDFHGRRRRTLSVLGSRDGEARGRREDITRPQ